MRAPRKIALAAVAAACMLVIPLAAAAGGDGRARWRGRRPRSIFTDNLRPIGFSARTVPADNFRRARRLQLRPRVLGRNGGPGHLRRLPAGRHLDPREPEGDHQLEDCASPTNTVGNQGDVIVWGDLIIRSWNSPTPAPQLPRRPRDPGHRSARLTQPGAFCGDWPMYRRLAAAPAASTAARRACTSSTSATRATRRSSRSSTRRAARTPRRWCPTSEQPAAGLQQLVGQHDVRSTRRRGTSPSLPRHRHHRGATGRSGRRRRTAVRAGGRPGRAARACTPATTPA